MRYGQEWYTVNNMAVCLQPDPGQFDYSKRAYIKALDALVDQLDDLAQPINIVVQVITNAGRHLHASIAWSAWTEHYNPAHSTTYCNA